MNFSGSFIFVVGSLAALPLHAADPAKVDYTKPNERFAPSAEVQPDKRTPESNRAVQDQRVSPAVTKPAATAPGERRAPVELAETRDKRLLAPETAKPEVRATELSPFDHRESRFRTDATAEKPRLISRYQDAMTSANTIAQERSPALGADTTARVNRFVFRRNVATPAPADGAVPVVRPATDRP